MNQQISSIQQNKSPTNIINTTKRITIRSLKHHNIIINFQIHAFSHEMSNNKQFEISITSNTNNLDEEKLKIYLASNGCSNIKKCKILSNANKAFITFKDNKSYEAALNLMPNNIEILPSNINLKHIFRNQQMIKKKLYCIDADIEQLRNNSRNQNNYNYKNDTMDTLSEFT
eukprot:514569_1